MIRRYSVIFSILFQLAVLLPMTSEHLSICHSAHAGDGAIEFRPSPILPQADHSQPTNTYSPHELSDLSVLAGTNWSVTIWFGHIEVNKAIAFDNEIRVSVIGTEVLDTRAHGTCYAQDPAEDGYEYILIRSSSNPFSDTSFFTFNIIGDTMVGKYTYSDWLGIYLDRYEFSGNLCSPLSASISASPTSGILPLTVSFTSTVTGEVDEYVWDFGDGESSNEPNPTHTYKKDDIDQVYLTVFGPCATEYTTNIDIELLLPPPPAVTIQASPMSGRAPLTVSFSSTVTGDVEKYVWGFGNGDISYLANPSYTYEHGGTYHVYLTVVGPYGHSMEHIDVVVLPPPPPIAYFSAAPLFGPAPLTVYFTNASSGALSSYLWDFGDGYLTDNHTSREENPVHTYETAGTYKVSLRANGPLGTYTKTRTDYIQVYPPGIPIPSSGIWKSHDGVLSMYFQKYTTRSCVMVLTMGNGLYTAFLDSNYGDGINAGNDIDGRGYTMSLVLTDTNHGTLTVTLPGYGPVVTPVQLMFECEGNGGISGIYAGPYASAVQPKAGIWKSHDGVLSMYVQKYGTGSSVIVVTMGDGIYTAFLDPDYGDGVSASNDVDGQGYALNLALTDAAQGTLTVTLPGYGEVTTAVALTFEGS